MDINTDTRYLTIDCDCSTLVTLKQEDPDNPFPDKCPACKSTVVVTKTATQSIVFVANDTVAIKKGLS